MVIYFSQNSVHEEGSVSKKVACVLSKNVRKIFNTDIGISITGVAGPTRDEKNNPVGRVYIGICFKRRVKVYMFNFKGTRNSIRKKASLQALKLIEEWIT
ncbi:MAG: hypothetical protein B6D55_08340 [Candidatus Omnitrophica bacterium 4484_70.2]|nr:MAG: hypothetical protein B6D55_08340 [Candidatus Omnitrophica bacterium 4484_70.2]